MQEKEQEKEKLLISILIVFILAVTFVLLFLINKQGDNVSVKSLITAAPKKVEFERDDALVNCVRIAYSDYVIWVPTAPTMTTEAVSGKYGDINYMIYTSDTANKDEEFASIPSRFYRSILGGKSTLHLLQKESGYLYGLYATHALVKASLKVSLRTESYYFSSYAIDLYEGRSVYVSVACKGKKNLIVAQECLDKLVSSITKYEDSSVEVQNAITEEINQILNSDKELDFDFESDTDEDADEKKVVPSEAHSQKKVQVTVPVSRECQYIVAIFEGDENASVSITDPNGNLLEKMEESKMGMWFFKGEGALPSGKYEFEGIGVSNAGMQGITEEEFNRLK